jgi:hypothetical protein
MKLEAWGDEDEGAENEEKIDPENHDEGEKSPLTREVTLAKGDHLNCKTEMEGPGKSESHVEDPEVGIEGLVEVDGDPEHGPDEGVEGNEVGGEGDEPIDDIRFDIASLTRDLEVEDVSFGEIDRPSVSQFVAENVEPDCFRNREKNDKEEGKSGAKTPKPERSPFGGRSPNEGQILQRPELGGDQGSQKKTDEKLQPFHGLTS